MGEMKRGQELHTRSCNSENLSEAEQAELEVWYAQMDAEEAAMLNRNAPNLDAIEALRAEYRLRLRELQEAIGDVCQIEERNEILRQQNEELKRQLAATGVSVAP